MSSRGDQENSSSSPPSPPRFWYLGIDFGTTGLSAVLLNAKTRQSYPISWSVMAQQGDTTEPLLRLPVEVYLKEGENENPVFSMALETTEVDRGLLLKNLKPYLKVGLSHYSLETNSWQPVLQWSEQQPVALYWFQQALQTLLTPLKTGVSTSEEIQSQSLMPDGPCPTSAIGLEPETFNSALDQLAGVVISYPADWPDAYRFNLREAVLGAGLVDSPDRICFVEEAIASLLAQLQTSNIGLRGNTLIIHAGATTTELALVELPANLEELTYSHLACRSFPYAGNAIDQDILCLLLLKNEGRRINEKLHSPSPSALAQKASDGVRFSSFIPDPSDLPLPGEPDLALRYRLQQRLASSPFGQTLLEAAKHLKLTLQQQDSSTLELDEHQWVLRQQDLEHRVYAPYTQSLNRELNALLVRQGISVEAIRQAICTGGTASIPAIAHWLGQKLPNATIIQDTDPAKVLSDDLYLGLSRIALGLATLPLYPQILDASQHQYSDYFLFLELLRVCGEQPLSVGRIMQLLERRGINTSTCHQRIIGFLEGYLPDGIVPSEPDSWLLTEESRQNLVAQASAYDPSCENAQTPLFFKEDNQTYRLNSEQRDRLQHYLNTVLERTQQKLEEPYAVYLQAPLKSFDSMLD